MENGSSYSPTPPLMVETPLGMLLVGGGSREYLTGDRVTALIRPEAAQVLPPCASGPNAIQAKLVDRSFRGSYTLIRAECAGGVVLTLEVSATGERNRSGELVTLRFDPAAISLLDRQ